MQNYAAFHLGFHCLQKFHEYQWLKDTFTHICESRPPDKSVYLKSIFIITHPKHMLWVLKRTV